MTSDIEKPLSKRHAIISALVGSVAVLVSYGIASGLTGTGSLARLPWRVEQAVVFLGLLACPGLYLGTIATGIVDLLTPVPLPTWLAVILVVVINAAVYSGSWMTIRRGGPGAALRRSVVLTPWILYGCFALWQALGTAD